MAHLSFASLSHEKLRIKYREILRHILVCQHSKDRIKVERHKMLLFNKLGYITVKNINNVFSKYKDYFLCKELVLTKDDMVFECFIVFDKCVMAFDWKKKGDFHWYYNSSIMRELIRLTDKHLNKHIKNEDIDDIISTGVETQFDLTEYYFESLKLTEIEQKMVISRLTSERSEEFLKKNKKMTKLSYYNILNSLKTKFKPIKDELESSDY